MGLIGGFLGFKGLLGFLYSAYRVYKGFLVLERVSGLCAYALPPALRPSVLAGRSASGAGGGIEDFKCNGFIRVSGLGFRV